MDKGISIKSCPYDIDFVLQCKIIEQYCRQYMTKIPLKDYEKHIFSFQTEKCRLQTTKKGTSILIELPNHWPKYFVSCIESKTAYNFHIRNGS